VREPLLEVPEEGMPVLYSFLKDLLDAWLRGEDPPEDEGDDNGCRGPGEP
jgi:hypothetical protein